MAGFVLKMLSMILYTLVSINQASAHNQVFPRSSSFHKRALVSETLCDDVQDNVIGNPLFQAVVLANATIDRRLLDGTVFRYSTAYSNYFEASDYPIVSSMFQAINDYTWKREQRTPEVWLLCSQPDTIPAACKDGKRIAFADPDPYPYTWDPTKWLPSSGIGFCASFFDPNNVLVNQMLYSKSKDEWCTGKTFGDFYNSGFFTMKLFVGMDVYGQLAKLPERSIPQEPGLYPRLTTHGAAIPDDPPNQSSQLSGRLLKEAWQAYESHGGQKPALQRVQNGPSFAAAATEWYFLTLCGRGRDVSIPV